MSQPSYRHLQCRQEQGVLVLAMTRSELQGEEIATELRHEMLQALDEFKPQNVIVDFTPIQYISSVAFWPLLSLHRKLQETGGRVTVCGLNSTVGDVFFSTRLVSPTGAFAAPFGVEPDVATALAHLAPHTP
jgi:anti-anti-sigma factor